MADDLNVRLMAVLENDEELHQLRQTEALEDLHFLIFNQRFSDDATVTEVVLGAVKELQLIAEALEELTGETYEKTLVDMLIELIPSFRPALVRACKEEKHRVAGDLIGGVPDGR